MNTMRALKRSNPRSTSGTLGPTRPRGPTLVGRLAKFSPIDAAHHQPVTQDRYQTVSADVHSAPSNEWVSAMMYPITMGVTMPTTLPTIRAVHVGYHNPTQ